RWDFLVPFPTRFANSPRRISNDRRKGSLRCCPRVVPKRSRRPCPDLDLIRSPPVRLGTNSLSREPGPGAQDLSTRCIIVRFARQRTQKFPNASRGLPLASAERFHAVDWS